MKINNLDFREMEILSLVCYYSHFENLHEQQPIVETSHCINIFTIIEKLNAISTYE